MIDPSLPADIYVDLAHRRGWTIRYVLETHIHADHLSRARALATRTGARLLLPVQQRAGFPSRQSPMAIASKSVPRPSRLHTPGHTGESTSFVLNDAAAVFTGDTLFTNGVGRPDLHADAEAARAGPRLVPLARSLAGLPSTTLVLPAHASDPIAFDGQPIAASCGDVASWLSEWLASESGFVERVTSKLPPTPPNFVRIVDLNESGRFPTSIRPISKPARIDAP